MVSAALGLTNYMLQASTLGHITIAGYVIANRYWYYIVILVKLNPSQAPSQKFTGLQLNSAADQPLASKDLFFSPLLPYFCISVFT